MSTEESRDDPSWLKTLQTLVDPQQLELVLLIQAIASFAFNRGDTQREHLPEEMGRSFGQFVLAGCSSLPHCRQYSPTVAGDLEIAPALGSLNELVGSPTRKCEVGVAVDQAWNGQPATSVDLFRAMVFVREIFLRANP